MRLVSSLILVLAGVIAGVAFVVSCGDDSPSNADAATCSCPPAEAPIAGRVTTVSSVESVDAMSEGILSTGCPNGSILLTGGCTLEAVGTGGKDLVVRQSGFDGTNSGWFCFVKNNESTALSVKIVVSCLNPAS